jgi:anti-repressor protein
MEELVKVTTKGNQQLVDARELHTFLESKERFSKWFNRMIEYGFIKDEDYTLYQNVHPQNKQEITDYALTLDMAKELSMLARNEKGKQARQYFIAMEKKALHQLPQTFSEALMLAAKQAEQIEQQQAKLIEQTPKVEAYEVISNSERLSTFDECGKLFGMGRNNLYKWMKKNKYVKHNNVPYQKYVDRGLLDYKIDEYKGKQYYVCLMTGKGIVYFQDKFNTDTINSGID